MLLWKGLCRLHGGFSHFELIWSHNAMDRSSDRPLFRGSMKELSASGASVTCLIGLAWYLFRNSMVRSLFEAVVMEHDSRQLNGRRKTSKSMNIHGNSEDADRFRPRTKGS